MKNFKQAITKILSEEDLTLDMNIKLPFGYVLEQVIRRCFEALGNNLYNLIDEYQATDDELGEIIWETSLYELLGLIKSKTQEECSEDDDFNGYLRLKKEALSICKDNQEIIDFINSPLF